MDGWSGRMEGRLAGWLAGRTDGRMDGWTHGKPQTPKSRLAVQCVGFWVYHKPYLEAQNHQKSLAKSLLARAAKPRGREAVHLS